MIAAWADNCSGPCIYWLSSVAGTGKSTICRTIARQLDNEKRLGASFFFSRGQGDLGNACKFITTIALQLAHVIPVLVPKICRAVVDHPDIGRRGLREQWKHLILQPLCELNETPKESPFVIVIDALDECENDDDVKLILHLLSEAKLLDVVRLRIFVTSRPETPIRLGFKEIRGAQQNIVQDVVLHEIEKSTIEHDIKIFLRSELGKIPRNPEIELGWPGEEKIDLLCQMASELFIYASTACRFIAEPHFAPQKRLSMILQSSYVGQTQTEAVDTIYTTILQHPLKTITSEDQEVFSDEFRGIVGSIVILYKTLPGASLASLLGISIPEVNAKLSALHSVLDVPKDKDSPIKLLHLSFRDFLLDPKRCKDAQLRVSEQETHQNLFIRCLTVMEKQLKRDICNLVDPGIGIASIDPATIQECVSRELQYSCLYWASHLHASGIAVSDNESVHRFFETHFLHWLEALSLLGDMSEGIHAIEVLNSIMVVNSP